MKSEEELVIDILHLLTKERTGFELTQRIRARGIHNYENNEGQLYMLLHKLEQKGYLQTFWQEEDEKYYRMTNKANTLLTLADKIRMGTKSNYGRGNEPVKSLKELFLKEVLQNIKSREAREYVEKELHYHLQRSRSELITKGLSEENAEEQAVKQMGNPSELGQQLNKLHRPKIDWMLLGLLIVALGMGFLPLLSVQNEYGFNIVANQALYILSGVTTALTVMYIDYRKLEKWRWHF